MNLVPISGIRIRNIGTLFKSDLVRIMEFLSDNWEERFLERIQRPWRFGIFNEQRFQPRCPTSREDLRALSILRFNVCGLTGEYIVFFLSKKPLQYLNLRWSSSSSSFFRLYFLLKGSIPSDFVKLTNLRQLSLQENQLTGQYLHNFTLYAWTHIAASKRPLWTSSPSAFFAVLSWLCKGRIPREVAKLANLQVNITVFSHSSINLQVNINCRGLH